MSEDVTIGFSPNLDEATKDKLRKQGGVESVKTNRKSIICPYCKSSNVVPMGGPQRKAFSAGKAIAGGLLTGGIGVLAGFAGKKGKKATFMCMDCNKTFEAKIK